ncbi:hypothetical protein TNCV_639481 [Trichonephila clavipes]|nr:hypothetical protein TNCV_639481 [Trichonephila clavipes]
MAEDNAHPSEEEFSYFCFDCRNTTEETEKEFLYAGVLGACYTCTQCGEEFEAGFKTEKMNSGDTLPHSCDICGRTLRNSQPNFLYHSYKHSNKWPHRCPFFQKGFAILCFFEEYMRIRDNVRAICCIKYLNHFRGKICFKLLRSRTTHLYFQKCVDGPTPVEYVAF